ncbi:MAG TPA: type II secretion system protein GspM [Azospirillaceae bacterium]|nr:type II secretion system protein GspM [Azospirillaceae bacterium]
MNLPDPLARTLADPRQAARLFWLVTAVLALLLVGGVVLPLVGLHGDLAASVAAETKRVEVWRRVIARSATIDAERAEIEAAASPLDYLQGATDALAGAALQAQLAGLVQEQGAVLVSSQTLESGRAAPGTPGFSRVAVRLGAVVTPGQLRGLLHRLEAGQPLLVVDAMTLRPAEEGRLELTLDLHGWRRA